MGVALWALFASAVAAQPSADRSKEWQPSGTWVVRFEKDQCMALRGFVRAERKITLGLEPRPLGDSNRVLFEVPGDPKGLGMDHARLTIGGERQPNRAALIGPSTKKGFQIISFGASDEQLQGLTAQQWIEFAAAGKTIRVPVTSFSRVKKLLDDCEATLLDSWGFSLSEQARLATYPKPDRSFSQVFSSDDYPISAIRRDAVGQVDVRSMIGLDGKPKDCVVIRSSGHADLDSTTCRLFLERSKFTPAAAKDGKPMVAPVFVTLRWLMP